MADHPVPHPVPPPKPGPRGVGPVKGTLVVLAAALAGVLGVAYLRPADYSVSRAQTMVAPKRAAFDRVNDFREWKAWSPWAKLDPNMTETYSGAPSGAGAVYEWAGNGAVGAGRMTILDAKPGESVRIRLEFREPFPGEGEAFFTFRQERQNAFVTWTVRGTAAYPVRVIALFAGTDSLLGPDLETGLAALKALAEAER